MTDMVLAISVMLLSFVMVGQAWYFSRLVNELKRLLVVLYRWERTTKNESSDTKKEPLPSTKDGRTESSSKDLFQDHRV